MINDLSSVTVAILAGGQGTRLASVLPGQQKVVAKVRQQPFLEYILIQLNKEGFKNVVICTGHLGNQVREQFGNNYDNLSLSYSHEHSPLGTAGAIRLALPFLKSDTVMVMNGDSFCDANLRKFWQFHLEKNANGTIILTEVSNTSRYGRVEIDENDKITGFQEKKADGGTGFINAGIYLFKRSILLEIPEDTMVSFEKDMFPKWIGKKFYGFKSQGRFIDIGTPLSFKKAEEFFRRFVVLDRDGTIILDKHHLTEPSEVKLIPNAAKAIKKLNNLGLGVIIVTNQSVVGNGRISLKDLELIHKKMLDLLSKEGATIDGIYFCPHKVEDNCSCRKPKLGLIEQVSKEHNFDPMECFVIGDKALDIEMGQKMGATTFLVRTGYGTKVEEENIVMPDYTVDDLIEASDIILALFAYKKYPSIP